MNKKIPRWGWLVILTSAIMSTYTSVSLVSQGASPLASVFIGILENIGLNIVAITLASQRGIS